MVFPFDGILVSREKGKICYMPQPEWTSEKSQLRKIAACMISLISHCRQDKTIEMENRSVIARDWKWEEDATIIGIAGGVCPDLVVAT